MLIFNDNWIYFFLYAFIVKMLYDNHFAGSLTDLQFKMQLWCECYQIYLLELKDFDQLIFNGFSKFKFGNTQVPWKILQNLNLENPLKIQSNCAQFPKAIYES